jgi:hypothetical protein
MAASSAAEAAAAAAFHQLTDERAPSPTDADLHVGDDAIDDIESDFAAEDSLITEAALEAAAAATESGGAAASSDSVAAAAAAVLAKVVVPACGDDEELELGADNPNALFFFDPKGNRVYSQFLLRLALRMLPSSLGGQRYRSDRLLARSTPAPLNLDEPSAEFLIGSFVALLARVGAGPERLCVAIAKVEDVLTADGKRFYITSLAELSTAVLSLRLLTLGPCPAAAAVDAAAAAPPSSHAAMAASLSSGAAAAASSVAAAAASASSASGAAEAAAEPSADAAAASTPSLAIDLFSGMHNILVPGANVEPDRKSTRLNSSHLDVPI